MADSYKEQYKLEGTAYTAAMSNLSTVYAQGANREDFGGVDLREIIKFRTDGEGNILGLDTSGLANYSNLQQNEAV